MTEQINFKRADCDIDFDRIHRFNHQVFAEEVAQHSIHEDNLLVDKFHYKNNYFIAEYNDEIIGMICIHTQAPFSIEEKYPNFRNHFKDISEVAEVRLYAIQPKFRKHPYLAWGLIFCIVKFSESTNIHYVAISGIEEQKKLYEKLGFYALSAAVKSGNAYFYPMLLETKTFFTLHKETILKIEKYINFKS